MLWNDLHVMPSIGFKNDCDIQCNPLNNHIVVLRSFWSYFSFGVFIETN